MPQQTEAEIIAGIAKGLGFDTLETRNADGLDFREVAVWNVKAALEAAFRAGQAHLYRVQADEAKRAAAPKPPADWAAAEESGLTNIAYRIPGKGGWKIRTFPTQEKAVAFVDTLKARAGSDVEIRWGADR